MKAARCVTTGAPAMLLVLLMLGTSALLSACRTPSQVAFVQGSAEVTHDGLHRLARSPFAVAWVRPDTSFADYGKIWLLYGGMKHQSPMRVVQDRSGNPGIGWGTSYSLSDAMTRSLESALREIFREQIIERTEWLPAEGVEPGVLVVRTSLIDLVMHAPLEHLGDDDFMWVDSAGEVTVVVEIFDAETQQILARVADRGAFAPLANRPMQATPGAVTYEARRVFQGWGYELRFFLDDLVAATPSAS